MNSETGKGWRAAAQQLRRSNYENRRALQAFADLVEANVATVDPALCLALHHVAKRHGCVTGKRTIRKMGSVKVEQIPRAIWEVMPKVTSPTQEVPPEFPTEMLQEPT